MKLTAGKRTPNLCRGFELRLKIRLKDCLSTALPEMFALTGLESVQRQKSGESR